MDDWLQYLRQLLGLEEKKEPIEQDLVPVQSSNLAAVGYDPERRVMEVKFRNGGHYQYPNMDMTDYQSLLAATSKGRHFYNTIRKPKKQFTKLSAWERGFLKAAQEYQNKFLDT